MRVDSTIFREYDIRGVAGEKFSEEEIKEYEKYYGAFPRATLTKEIAEAIGKAYGTIIRRGGGKDIVIGHELRPFGEELKNAFIGGVRSTGCNVCDCGPSITPLIYFATAYGTFDGGVSVAGSHNLYFYNGFKLTKHDNWPIFGEELKALRGLVAKEDFIHDQPGTYSKTDFTSAYKEYFTDYVSLKRELKLVIDCGNGTAGLFAPEIFRSLRVEVVELYTKPDAQFPNHMPDPEAPQNLIALSKKVREVGADCGIAFDADADRVGFVDERGGRVDADMIMLIFAGDVLQRHPDKKILFDVKTSALLEELVPELGGIPVLSRTGHAPIAQALREDPDVIFAGESSGHFYIVEDYFKIDDGLFAAAKFLEIFSAHDGAFSSLFDNFPKRVRTPEIKLPCADERKFAIVAEIQKRLAKKFPAITVDGVRIRVSETGWGLIRASNTSPYITVRVEGATEEEVQEIKNILADELERFPEIGDRLNRTAVATLTGTLGWV